MHSLLVCSRAGSLSCMVEPFFFFRRFPNQLFQTGAPLPSLGPPHTGRGYHTWRDGSPPRAILVFLPETLLPFFVCSRWTGVLAPRRSPGLRQRGELRSCLTFFLSVLLNVLLPFRLRYSNPLLFPSFPFWIMADAFTLCCFVNRSLPPSSCLSSLPFSPRLFFTVGD